MSAALVADVWAAVRRDLTHYMAQLEPPAAEIQEESLLVLTGGPTADFNMAILDASPNDEVVLREFAARVRTAGAQAVFMLPGAIASRLARVTREAGMSEVGTAPLMLLDSSDDVPGGGGPGAFRVQRVQDAAGLGVVGDLIAEAFSLDRDWVGRTFAAPSLLGASGVDFWLATSDGQPYSTATLTHTATGPIGIWNMATRPALQRQGAGRAVLETAIRQHRRDGNTRFYLIATPSGKPLYESLGFTTVDDLMICIAGHSEQFAAH